MTSKSISKTWFLKTILVYGIVGAFGSIVSMGAEPKTLALEVKSQVLPVNITFEGVVVGQDEFLTLRSETPDVQIKDGKLIVPTGSVPEVRVQVGIQSTTSEIPQLRIQCPYCRVKFRSLPIHVWMNSRSVWVSAHQVYRLDIVAHSVTLLESSAVGQLSVTAQQLDARHALVAGQMVQADVVRQCEWGGTSFEVTSVRIECAESVVFNAAKVQSRELQLSSNRIMLQLWDATVSKLSLKTDRLFAWLYEKTDITAWTGIVKQARVFSVNPQLGFKRDASYPLSQFVYFNENVNVRPDAQDKKGALSIGSGFFMKTNSQDLHASADKTSDGQRSQNNSDASAMPPKGVR